MIPEHFWFMLLGVVIVFALTLVLFAIGYRLVDWITPGHLHNELLGHGDKPPNLPLAVLVSSLALGLAIVLGCTIIAMASF